LELFFC